MPNLGHALAVEPPVLSAYLLWLHSLGATSLDAVAQQVAMAAASRANAADYGVAVHATLTGKLGAVADVADALRTGSALADPKLEAARQFATAIASKRTQVSDTRARSRHRRWRHYGVICRTWPDLTKCATDTHELTAFLR